MARALYLNDGAAWRRARALWVHDGTAWRKARAVHVHDGAAWRASAASQPVNFGGSVEDYFVGTTGAASCTCSFGEDGGITLFASHGGSSSLVWYDAPEAGIGAGYWVRATLLSGSAPNSGAAVGAWLALSAARWWGYSSATTGAFNARSGSIRFEISSDATGSAIVCSGTINFSATREA